MSTSEEPQHSAFLFRRRKRAQAQFTDRKEPMSVLRDAARQLLAGSIHGSDRSTVIQFYGIGGIGKTRLLEEFSSWVLHDTSRTIVSRVDFDDESVRVPHRALLRLRRSTQGASRVDFRHFDLAYAIHFAKRNPDFVLAKRNLPFLEEAGIVGDVIASMDGLGIAGALKGIIEQLHRLLQWLKITGEAGQAIEELRVMSEREIEETLPDFLAYDLTRHVANDGLAVLEFDTYERLWKDYSSEKDLFSSDSWVRRLARGLPRGLFVVGGRERIRWDEFEDGWTDYLRRELLDRLSPKDSLDFILTAGISDRTLAERMRDVSEGHPFFLDLCVDAYLEGRLLGVDQSAHAWPHTQRELFERFIRSIQDVDLSLLRCLAPLSSYSLDYARAASLEFRIPLSEERLQSHYRFSFVKLHEREATIHEIMRQSILANTQSEHLREIRKFALRYFSGCLLASESTIDDEAIGRALREAAYQLSFLAETTLVDEWLAGPAAIGISKLQDRAAASPILASLRSIRRVRHPRFWPDHVRTAFADMTHLVGQYEDAVDLLTEQLDHHSRDDILRNDELSFALVRRLHHKMLFMPLEDIWSDAILIAAPLEKYGRQIAFCECAFLVGGNLGAARGHREEAVPWLEKAMALAHDAACATMKARCLRKMSDFERMSGNLNHAELLLREGISLAQSLGTRRYELYLLCTLGDYYRLAGDFDAAYSAFTNIRESFAALNMEGWIGHTYMGEASTALDRGDVAKSNIALGLAQRYYERTNHAWGLAQVMIQQLRFKKIQGSTDQSMRMQAETVANHLSKMGYYRDAIFTRSIAVSDVLRAPAISFL